MSSLPALLAARAALDAAIAAAQGTTAVEVEPLKTEETGDVPNTTKGNDMAKATVFQDRGKWKVRITDRETKRTTTTSYDTEQAARKAAPALLAEYERPKGVRLPKALSEYRQALAAGGVKGDTPNKPRTLETTMGRLNSVLGDIDTVTGELTAEQATKAWTTWKTTINPSVDTQANTLNQIRTFFRWCAEREYLDGDPLAKVKVVGKRRKGKKQLGIDESRAFTVKALVLAAGGDVGALAAATALLLGLRASEVTSRTIAHLDAGGTVLVVTDAKTEAGNRRQKIPTVLQPHFRQLAAGKASADLIFGAEADRQWLRRQVARVCKLAGVTLVGPHGLRGTHATLAVQAGVSGEAVAASLGHASFAVTAAHYATSESVAGASADRFLAALN